MFLPICWSPPCFLFRTFFTPAFFPLSPRPTTPPLFRVSLRLLSLFPRCPRTSSPPHSPVTRAQPITTWAETMGSGDKPGASQSNPFDRVETLLELPRPPFQPLKCIVTFHPEIKEHRWTHGASVRFCAPFPMHKQRGNNFLLTVTFRPPFRGR